jgi:hypothetical protein
VISNIPIISLSSTSTVANFSATVKVSVVVFISADIAVVCLVNSYSAGLPSSNECICISVGSYELLNVKSTGCVVKNLGLLPTVDFILAF